MRTFVTQRIFWLPTLITAILLAAFFGWELNAFAPLLPGPPRPEPTQTELLFTAVIIVLLSLNVGLFNVRCRHGTCPRGTRRASGIAAALGAFTLLCPACLLLPVSIAGGGLSLAVFAPHLPLLRVVAIALLGASTLMLWPKK